MKIIKEKSREYKGTPYFKFRVNLPWKVIRGAGFKEGDELDAEYLEGQILIKKKNVEKKDF